MATQTMCVLKVLVNRVNIKSTLLGLSNGAQNEVFTSLRIDEKNKVNVRSVFVKE